MPSLLSKLTGNEQARLLEELNYTNLAEIRHFCDERGIPYRIVAEYPNGKAKTTKDIDRKPIVLAHVRHYLTTGDPGEPTRIPATIVRTEKPPARPATSRPSLLSLVCEGVRRGDAFAARVDGRPVP